MTIEDKIINYLKHTRRHLSASEIDHILKINSRTYTSRVLNHLKQKQQIKSERFGRNIIYYAQDVLIGLEQNLVLVNLQEDLVWDQLQENQEFTQRLSENVENILYFAFSEMLNNAIDHSRSSIGYIKIWVENNTVKFIVRDHGIGVFRNLMSKKNLPDIITAIQELVKGKQTTLPRRHSGEGIFWTSKIADYFELRSFEYTLLVDNHRNDYAIKNNAKSIIGTEVYFEISLKTLKTLGSLFEAYSLNQQYTFNTTLIPIKLFEYGNVWVSRSQAKRLLYGLEKYQKIILDFAHIDFIGQGFADEIFRVFVIAHPNIIIEAINTNPTVDMMIRHAELDSTGR